MRLNKAKTAPHFEKKIHFDSIHGRCLYDWRSDISKVLTIPIWGMEEECWKVLKSRFLCIFPWLFLFLKKYLNWKLFSIKLPTTRLPYLFWYEVCSSVTECWRWPFFLRIPKCRNLKKAPIFNKNNSTHTIFTEIAKYCNVLGTP